MDHSSVKHMKGGFEEQQDTTLVQASTGNAHLSIRQKSTSVLSTDGRGTHHDITRRFRQVFHQHAAAPTLPQKKTAATFFVMMMVDVCCASAELLVLVNAPRAVGCQTNSVRPSYRSFMLVRHRSE